MESARLRRKDTTTGQPLRILSLGIQVYESRPGKQLTFQ